MTNEAGWLREMDRYMAIGESLPDTVERSWLSGRKGQLDTTTLMRRAALFEWRKARPYYAALAAATKEAT